MKFTCMMIARKLYSIFALGALLQVECGDNPEVVAISNPQTASDDESPISVLKIWDGNPEDKAPTRNRPPKKSSRQRKLICDNKAKHLASAQPEVEHVVDGVFVDAGEGESDVGYFTTFDGMQIREGIGTVDEQSGLGPKEECTGHAMGCGNVPPVGSFGELSTLTATDMETLSTDRSTVNGSPIFDGIADASPDKITPKSRNEVVDFCTAQFASSGLMLHFDSHKCLTFENINKHMSGNEMSFYLCVARETIEFYRRLLPRTDFEKYWGLRRKSRDMTRLGHELYRAWKGLESGQKCVVAGAKLRQKPKQAEPAQVVAPPLPSPPAPLQPGGYQQNPPPGIAFGPLPPGLSPHHVPGPHPNLLQQQQLQLVQGPPPNHWMQHQMSPQMSPQMPPAHMPTAPLHPRVQELMLSRAMGQMPPPQMPQMPPPPMPPPTQPPPPPTYAAHHYYSSGAEPTVTTVTPGGPSWPPGIPFAGHPSFGTGHGSGMSWSSSNSVQSVQSNPQTHLHPQIYSKHSKDHFSDTRSTMTSRDSFVSSDTPSMGSTRTTSGFTTPTMPTGGDPSQFQSHGLSPASSSNSIPSLVLPPLAMPPPVPSSLKRPVERTLSTAQQSNAQSTVVEEDRVVTIVDAFAVATLRNRLQGVQPVPLSELAKNGDQLSGTKALEFCTPTRFGAQHPEWVMYNLWLEDYQSAQQWISTVRRSDPKVFEINAWLKRWDQLGGQLQTSLNQIGQFRPDMILSGGTGNTRSLFVLLESFRRSVQLLLTMYDFYRDTFHKDNVAKKTRGVTAAELDVWCESPLGMFPKADPAAINERAKNGVKGPVSNLDALSIAKPLNAVQMSLLGQVLKRGASLDAHPKAWLTVPTVAYEEKSQKSAPSPKISFQHAVPISIRKVHVPVRNQWRDWRDQISKYARAFLAAVPKHVNTVHLGFSQAHLESWTLAMKYLQVILHITFYQHTDFSTLFAPGQPDTDLFSGANLKMYSRAQDRHIYTHRQAGVLPLMKYFSRAFGYDLVQFCVSLYEAHTGRPGNSIEPKSFIFLMGSAAGQRDGDVGHAKFSSRYRLDSSDRDVTMQLPFKAWESYGDWHDRVIDKIKQVMGGEDHVEIFSVQQRMFTGDAVVLIDDLRSKLTLQTLVPLLTKPKQAKPTWATVLKSKPNQGLTLSDIDENLDVCFIEMANVFVISSASDDSGVDLSEQEFLLIQSLFPGSKPNTVNVRRFLQGLQRDTFRREQAWMQISFRSKSGKFDGSRIDITVISERDHWRKARSAQQNLEMAMNTFRTKMTRGRIPMTVFDEYIKLIKEMRPHGCSSLKVVMMAFAALELFNQKHAVSPQQPGQDDTLLRPNLGRMQLLELLLLHFFFFTSTYFRETPYYLTDADRNIDLDDDCTPNMLPHWGHHEVVLTPNGKIQFVEKENISVPVARSPGDDGGIGESNIWSSLHATYRPMYQSFFSQLTPHDQVLQPGDRVYVKPLSKVGIVQSVIPFDDGAGGRSVQYIVSGCDDRPVLRSDLVTDLMQITESYPADAHYFRGKIVQAVEVVHGAVNPQVGPMVRLIHGSRESNGRPMQIQWEHLRPMAPVHRRLRDHGLLTVGVVDVVRFSSNNGTPTSPQTVDDLFMGHASCVQQPWRGIFSSEPSFASGTVEMLNKMLVPSQSSPADSISQEGRA